MGFASVTSMFPDFLAVSHTLAPAQTLDAARKAVKEGFAKNGRASRPPEWPSALPSMGALN